MRIITEKDKRGLLVAFRTFIRPFTGERISQVAGNAIIERALEAGVSFDALLNKENWGRAQDIIPSLSASEYVELLAENKIEVKKLTDEPGWHETENGFDLIAEAAHDFFMEVSGKGGKWNIPSAKANLAKAIKTYSLEAILSEDLIKQVCTDPDTTFFLYILAILKDLNSLVIVTEPTEAEAEREKMLDINEETLDNLAVNPRNENNDPEPEFRPGEEEETEDDLDLLGAGLGIYNGDAVEEPEFTTSTRMAVTEDPHKTKVDAIKNILFSYSPAELDGIIGVIRMKDGRDPRTLTFDEIVNAIADGNLDVKKESFDAANIHSQMNGDLTQQFIECVRASGVEMDDALAAKYDILCDSWDLRDPNTRKFYKLQNLINRMGNEDEDLLASIKELEAFYLGE